MTLVHWQQSSSLKGGTLKINQSSTVSGAVSIAGNSAIDVASGKTVIFSAGAINTNNYELTSTILELFRSRRILQE